MSYLHQVRSGIDFIESKLNSDISTNAVAKHVGVSQWHFQRIFKALTNETLQSYIRARRLANSLDLLLTTELRILDIALAAGYENQEYQHSYGPDLEVYGAEYHPVSSDSTIHYAIPIQ